MRKVPFPKSLSHLSRMLLSLLGLLVACSPSEPSGDIVLVVLDTTRADHLSCYGYERETTPHLDRLAAEGELYAHAFAQAPWTLPAVASILTGQPPHVHGAGRGDRGIFPVSPLRDEVVTLAERLSAEGFATAAFTNVAWCRPESGLARGFDHYDFQLSDETNQGHRDARETTDAALSWLRGIGERRFLLVVHYFDPHLVYAPPPPFDSEFDEVGAELPPGFGSARMLQRVRRGGVKLDRGQRETLVARYDGELRFMDEQFGRLREGLEALGRFDDALVVVVGDHGEEFWDHGGFEHGHTHYLELLHVPLIVKRPGNAGGVVKRGRARQIDVAPTLLSFAGIDASELPGEPLGSGSPAYSVAEGSLWSGDLASIQSDRGTLIVDRSTGEGSFFGPDDGAQLRPLSVDEAPELMELLQALPPTRMGSVGASQPGDEEREQLRALGYAE